MAEKKSTVTLEYLIDKAESSEVRAQLLAIQKDIQGTGTAARTASTQTVQAIKAETNEFNKLHNSIREVRAETNGLKDVDRAFTSAQRALSGIGVGGSVGAAVGGIGDIAQLGQTLPELVTAVSALGPAAAIAAPAIGLTALALQNFSKILEDGKKALDAAFVAQEAYYSAVQKLTSVQAQNQIDDLKSTNQKIQAEIDETNKSLAGGAQSIKDNFSGVFEGARLLFGEAGKTVAENLAITAGPTGDAVKRLQDLQKQLEANNSVIQRLSDGLKQDAFAANDDAEAIKASTAARLKELDALAQQETQLQGLTRKGTSDQVKEQIAANQDRVLALTLEYNELVKLAPTSEDAARKLQDVSAEIVRLNNQNSELTNGILPLVQAREKEAAAIKYQQQQQKDIAAATQKYNDDVAKINEQAQAAQLAALDKYNESLVKAAETAARAAEEALQKLQERRADLATSLARNEADAQAKYQFDQLNTQIKFQEEEAKAARDHARDLQKIREDAQAEEFDLILNRDFAGLFKSRQDTQRRLTDAERQYQDERRDRQVAYEQQNAEAARQYAFEAQQRQIKYQQDLADAQLQYNRERQQIEQNRQRALIEARSAYAKEVQLVQQKEQQQLTIRRNAAVAELQMLSQTEQQRVQIMAQSQAALIQQAQSMLALVGGGGTPVVAGPVGSGILAGGTSNNTANMNFNISGNNPVNIANAVKSIVHGEIANIFG